MNRVFPVEVRSFSSLDDLSAFIEKGIFWYEGFLKEYNQSLGDLLREQGGSNEELEKRLREKGLARQTAKKGKKSAPSASEGWSSFKGLMFSAENQKKAEIFFEAADKIKQSLERLKEAKTSIEELQKIGLGPDLTYSVYFVGGIPEKIFVEPSGNSMPKYKLEMLLSTSLESLAAMEEKVKETEESIAAQTESKVAEKSTPEESSPGK